MSKYSRFEVEPDIIKKRKHIYYLVGIEEGTSKGYILGSYSVKANRVIIKNNDNYLPPSNVIQDFIKIAQERYIKENQNET